MLINDPSEINLDDNAEDSKSVSKFEKLHILPPESAASAFSRYKDDKITLSGSSSTGADSQHEADEVRLSYNYLQDSYKQVKHELNVAKQQIEKYEEDLEHPVPRYLYIELQQQNAELKEEHLRTLDEFRILNYDLQKLMDSTEKVLKERDDYYNFAAGARGSCTPRPDWNKCAQIVDGGYKRWAEISANKSSNELVDVILNEIVGGNDPLNNSEYITCLGTAARVPRFLRYYGEVKYRRLRKRDLCLCIKDIWDEKMTLDGEVPASSRTKLSDFVLDYFAKRFHEEKSIYEWSYNLYEGCKRYLTDSCINLFYAVLTEEVDEGVYIHQLADIARLTRGIYVKHYEAHQYSLELNLRFSDDETTPFTKSMFLEVLQTVFPGKGQKALGVLLRAAIEESQSAYTEIIDYNKILCCDDEGHFSKFLTVLTAQLREEKIIYCAQIIKELPTLNEINPADLYQAVCRVDPEITADEVERYLQWVYKRDVSSIDQTNTILINNLAQQLENGALWNHTAYTPSKIRASVADIMTSHVEDSLEEA